MKARSKKEGEHVFERLLVPLDTGEVAEQVLPYVRLLAKGLGQPVTLVSVVADAGELNPVASAHDAAIAALIDKRREYAQRYLDAIRARLEAEGVAVSTEVRVGSVADSIVAAASALHAGLVVMATHGRVGPERWFLGSVADRVVRTAASPVLLVRPRADGVAPAVSVREILLPLDGSPAAEAALPAATVLAQAFHVPVTLIRTLPMPWFIVGADPYGGVDVLPPEVLGQLEDEAKRYLEQVAAQLRTSGVATKVAFASFRQPAQEITDLAEATSGALVVMTTHGRSGLSRTVLGSVTDRVIRSSAAPVLMAREAS